jgi:hypothetical protein
MASRPFALVTGASGGIGLALAREAVASGYDVALVARSEGALGEAAAELRARGADALVVVADLAEPAAPRAVVEALGGRPVDLLVNNAGFATFGLFADLDLDRELSMIAVNVVALTALTRLCLPGMVERGSGRILNVASTAAFFPGPWMTVYYATKHYVLAFSDGLAEELAGTGVTVTTLAPGPTASGFQARAQMERSKLLESGTMDAAVVARAGLRGALAGRRTVVPGLRARLQVQVPRVLPRRLLAAVVRRAQAPH